MSNNSKREDLQPKEWKQAFQDERNHPTSFHRQECDNTTQILFYGYLKGLETNKCSDSQNAGKLGGIVVMKYSKMNNELEDP